MGEGTSATPDHRLADRRTKRGRMLDLLDAVGADRLVLSTPAATSWYLDGARTQVALLGPAVVQLEIGADGDVVHLPDNEASRLIAEELPGDVELRMGSWHEWGPAKRPGTVLEGEVEPRLRAARSMVLPGELARYRALCRESAEILTRVLAEAEPGWSERRLAARLSAEAVGIGAEPVVLLVAGRERLGHRHPLPTRSLLGDRVMAVLGVRRHGMIANLTRWVRFHPVDADSAAVSERLLLVEAEFFAATRPGALLAEVFQVGCSAYARHGFDADEWERHHQGGVAGYNGRDPRAAPGVPDVVSSSALLSWNPSAHAAKVEDTVLVTEAGLEVLTVDPHWPVTTVAGLARPAELLL